MPSQARPCRARGLSGRRHVVALARLRHHPMQEHRVAHQVSPPHPLRLDRQSEDPFQSIVGQRGRCARNAPRDEVKQRPDAPQHVAVQAVDRALRPDLLLRRSHADEQDVGLARVDVLDHALVVSGADLEVAVVRADDAQLRVRAAQTLAGLRGDARVAAEQVHRAVLRLAQRGEVPDPVGAGHPVRDLGAQRLRGQAHPVAVAVDEVGALERLAQRGILARLVEDVRVDVHHALRRLVPANPVDDPLQQLIGMPELDRELEDPRLARL